MNMKNKLKLNIEYFASSNTLKRVVLFILRIYYFPILLEGEGIEVNEAILESGFDYSTVNFEKYYKKLNIKQK